MITTASPLSCRMRLRVSMPLMPGRRMSSRTRSMSCVGRSRRASSPLPAMSVSYFSDRIVFREFWSSLSSSTMRILYRYMALPFVDGESKRERRSLPFAAFDLDHGAVLLQDLVGDGEAQPRPLRFGREEGV